MCDGCGQGGREYNGDHTSLALTLGCAMPSDSNSSGYLTGSSMTCRWRGRRKGKGRGRGSKERGGKVRGGEEDDIKLDTGTQTSLISFICFIGQVRYLFHHHQTYKGIHLCVVGEVIVTMVTSEIYLGGEYLV